MKKFILTALILSVFLCTGLINLSYAEDFLKDVAGFSGTNGIDEETPIILAQVDNEMDKEEIAEEPEEKPEEEPAEDLEGDPGEKEEEKDVPTAYDFMPGE